MEPPLFVRPPTDAERQALAAGLRSTDALTLRRCQMVLASAHGERVPAIARALGCGEQTVRNVIHTFDERGVAALPPGSSRPHTIHADFDAAGVAQLRALLHRSPREFGHPTSLWTLEVLAETACREELTATRVTGETIRATLARCGIRWRRAKTWITSPDPAYAPKTAPRSVDRAGGRSPGLGGRLRRRDVVEPPGPPARPYLDRRQSAAAGRADRCPRRSRCQGVGLVWPAPARPRRTCGCAAWRGGR